MNLNSKKGILVRNLLGSVVPIIGHDDSFERPTGATASRLQSENITLPPLAVERSPAEMAVFRAVVAVDKTHLARCRIWETTSVSTPVGLAISGRHLISLPRSAPVAAEAPS